MLAATGTAIVRADVEISGTGAVWMDAADLDLLGCCGEIIAVIVRRSSGTGALDGTVYIGDDALDNTPDDRDLVYESGSVSFGTASSSTSASLRDVLPVRAPYAVAAPGDLKLGCNIATGSNSNTLSVTIYAEVYG